MSAPPVVPRQREALRHDRELFDLADLRRLLDESTAMISDAGDALDELAIGFSEHGAALPGDVREEIGQSGNKLDTLNARTHVRMGEHAPLTIHLQACVDAVHDGGHAARHLEDAARSAERGDAIKAARDALVVATGKFVETAVERAGTAEPS